MQSVPITTEVVSSNPAQARCTGFCDKVCQWLAAGQWFSPGTPVSSTNKTDCHDISEILLKEELNTITFTNIPHVALIAHNTWQSWAILVFDWLCFFPP